MRKLWLLLVLLIPGLSVHTNENTVDSLNAENKLFIITIDGLRWQELFSGADPELIRQVSSPTARKHTRELYDGASATERRKKLFPFFWTTVAQEGALYGNRNYGNKMNVSNPYALSYPGYNELLTGNVDLSIFGNGKTVNRNLSLLDYLNATAAFRGKVAAFASWDAFAYILHKGQSDVYINSGFETVQSERPTETLLNKLQQEWEEKKNVRDDSLTFKECKTYIEMKKPSVVLLSFGGTDEAAHQKHYDQYLQQAANADKMISDLWQYVQTTPEYAGKTTFLITTDHGRGSGTGNWYTHGIFVNGSSQTWMGLLGKNIQESGEKKTRSQVYEKNLRALMLGILSMP